MIILGIETATPQVGCALGGDEGTLASFQAAGGRRHAETLAPAIEFVCRHARIRLDEVGAIAVDVGPGLFTGLRVGVATGQALATALKVPMVALSSLDVLVHPERPLGRLVAAVVDARRGEVFWALYRDGGPAVERITPYAVSPPSHLAAELASRGEACLAIGDGARRYAELLAQVSEVEVGPAASAHPSAVALVELALQAARREEFVPPVDLRPLYLRTADVRVNWETRAPGPIGAAPLLDRLAVGRGANAWPHG